MKQKKMLALTLSQLKQLYRHELPELTGIAARSGDADFQNISVGVYGGTSPSGK